MCVRHPKVPAVEGKTKCQVCLDHTKDYNDAYRKELRRKGMCPNHIDTPSAPGKKMCQNCITDANMRRNEDIARGICIAHPNVFAAPGKTMCYNCLDDRAVYKLPKSIQAVAKKRAVETQEARINGTYICPVLGKTEKELRELFSFDSDYTVWQFDHKGDVFRDIISRRMNVAIGNLTSEQLLQGVTYVRKHEVR